MASIHVIRVIRGFITSIRVIRVIRGLELHSCDLCGSWFQDFIRGFNTETGCSFDRNRLRVTGRIGFETEDPERIEGEPCIEVLHDGRPDSRYSWRSVRREGAMIRRRVGPRM